MAMTVVVGYVWGRSYLRSEAFRVSMSQQVSNLLGVEGDFSALLWKSDSVGSEAFRGSSKDTAKVSKKQLLDKIEARNIRVDLDWGSLWKNTFQMQRLEIDSLHLELSDKQKEKQHEIYHSGFENKNLLVNETLLKQGSRAWYQRFLPKEIALSDTRVDSLSVGYIAADGRRFSMENSQVDVEFLNHEVSVQMQGGVLDVEHELLDQVVLDSAKWNYRERNIYIQSLQASVYDGAGLELSGQIGEKGEDYELQGTILGVDCHHFLSDLWQSRLEGEMAVRFSAKKENVRSKGGSELRGELKVRNGVLKGLRVLDQIAAYSETRGFQTLRFSKFQCRFLSRADTLEIRDVFLHCDGLMRIEGGVSIQHRKLKGEFQLGIVPGVLRHIPGAEQKIFLPGKDQLLWASVKISGTLEDIEEDLSERMFLAAGMRMFEVIPETGLQVLRFTSEGIESVALPEGFEPLSELLNATGLGEGANLAEEGIPKFPLKENVQNVPVEILEESQNLLESSLEGIEKLGNLFEPAQREPKYQQNNE